MELLTIFLLLAGFPLVFMEDREVIHNHLAHLVHMHRLEDREVVCNHLAHLLHMHHPEPLEDPIPHPHDISTNEKAVTNVPNVPKPLETKTEETYHIYVATVMILIITTTATIATAVEDGKATTFKEATQTQFYPTNQMGPI
jgi:galactose-1-phosphate uridylyltransferase